MSEWEYDELTGPHTWHLKYPNAAGSHQSPVNIETSKVVVNPNLRNDLHYTMTRCGNAKFSNIRHTCQVEMDTDAALVGSALGGSRYKFAQFHFHWGKGHSNGSEHAINGNRFCAELHIVNFKEEYGSFNEATNHPDGVAVVAFFLTTGNHHDELRPVLNQLSRIKYVDDVVEEVPFNLENFLQHHMRHGHHGFYSYSGSLTTPPCNECVHWLIMRQHVEISKEQLAEFHQLCRTKKGESEEYVTANHRPICPLNERVVNLSA